MRFTGTLRSWNEDRGFGFIAPTQGGREIFVHVSAFPRIGSRPTVGEKLTFEFGKNSAGKPQAIHVQREALVAPGAQRFRPRQARPQRPSRFGRRLAILLAIGLSAYGYAEYSKRTAPVSVAPQGVFTPSPVTERQPVRAPEYSTPTAPASVAPQRTFTPSPVTELPPARIPDFRCDGRIHCSQMTSCAEATYFLQRCPGTKMDGDGDGVPCEVQWCR
jgi:cold shock CspA family protein